MTVIDDYLKKIDPAKRKELERIREIAKRIVPDAEEVISYGMPSLKIEGTSFLGFDAHINHIGIYPYGGEEIQIFKEELKHHNYSFSKGAIQIPLNSPIPEGLLVNIINHRLKRIKK